MLASIVIRTLDEERYLQALLEAIASQETGDIDVEVVLVDSGSRDRTLEIARAYACRVETIAREDFSFGRSLNVGCAASDGDFLVFVSGHCIPSHEHWLENLLHPLTLGAADYVYGRQLAGQRSRFSEAQLFKRQYPERSVIPQEGIFCNNANAALRRDLWEKFLFDTDSSGLEDMELAKKLVAARYSIGYVADAPVFHHHDETWKQVRWRFEREALALQSIMPDVHISRLDMLRYFTSAVTHDLFVALGEDRLASVAWEVVCFRWQQYWGSYRGNHDLRKLSKERKEQYFYPSRL